MKSVRITVPTNEGTTLFPKMLGLAKEFYIYQVADETHCELMEKRINPYERTMQHLKTLDVYEVIRDCSVIIASHIGKGGIGRLEGKGVELFFSKGNIQDALEQWMSKRREGNSTEKNGRQT